MVDTGFEVPAAKRDRFTSDYRPADGGGLELADGPDGELSRPPAFAVRDRAASPRPPTTGTASPGMLLGGGRSTAAACCRPSRCGR